METVDPITLSVIRGRLDRIVDEMDTTLMNSAFSPIICEAGDMTNGLYRPDGRTITQGDAGLPIFVGSMEFVVTWIADNYSRDDIEPGDVFITNDPYIGGTHLNDVKLVKPYFVDDEVFVFLSNTGHWVDVGGGTPGGWGPSNTEVYQEGVRIPPTKLFEAGERNDSLLGTIFANVRQPDNSRGDLKAQLNALDFADSQMAELLETYGRETLASAIEELEARSEKQMRSRFEEIPDGTYESTDYLDNDGIVDEPLKIHVELTVDGDEVLLDFTGSAGPTAGPPNLSRGASISCCNVLIKHTIPDIPINAGCFTPISVNIPSESLLNAKPPSPTAGYPETSQRVVDVVSAAFSKTIPEKMTGNAFSTTGAVTIGGTQDGESYVVTYAMAGGYGGSSEADGLAHGSPLIGRAKMPSLETLEDQYPVVFNEKSLRPDSGGPGRHRGGLGTVTEIELLEDASASCLGDRADYTPKGIVGGENGDGSEYTFVRDGEPYTPKFRTKEQDIPLSAGDRIRIKSPGGGGYGPPSERERSAVLRDVELGYISRTHAAERYDVQVDDETVAVDDDREASAGRHGHDE